MNKFRNNLIAFCILLAPLAVLGQAPKLSELRAAPIPVWDFVAGLPFIFEAQLFYVIVLLGALGVFFNYAVKWMKKEIAGSLIAYLFHDNVRGTLLSVSTTIGTGVMGITSGMFETPDGTFIGWFRVFILAFGNGFLWDSVMNKGARPEAQKP